MRWGKVRRGKEKGKEGKSQKVERGIEASSLRCPTVVFRR